MFRKILAVIASAACAGVIVGFVPEPTQAIAARTPQSVQPRWSINTTASQPVVAAVPRAADVRKASCKQGWPYYERSCLHDARRSDGAARVVRVIGPGRSVAGRTLLARR
jgi:hypothetical protein